MSLKLLAVLECLRPGNAFEKLGITMTTNNVMRTEKAPLIEKTVKRKNINRRIHSKICCGSRRTVTWQKVQSKAS